MSRVRQYTATVQGALGTVGPVAAAAAAAEVKLPTVKLDTTLTELCRRASPRIANTRLGWLSCGVTGGLDLTPDVPRNAKFAYQDQAFIATPREQLQLQLQGGGPRGSAGELRRSLAKKYLSLVPQRDAFIAGAAPVVIFHLDRTPAQREHDRREAETTLAALDPSQRPELVFCPGPAAMPLREHGIEQLEYKVVFDALRGYPLTHDPETHWFLNSKAALAGSGLPTPRAEIIETEGVPPAEAGECCAVCAAEHEETETNCRSHNTTDPHPHPPSIIPPGCTGPRGRWLDAQSARILDAVRARPVPFVFKTQQAFGGAGTWLVRTGQQKQRLVADLSGAAGPGRAKNDGILRKLLSQLTPQNRHLRPTAVVLTELVARPVGDYGLTFVVTSPDSSAGGEPIFLAAAEQMLARAAGGAAGDGAWVGSTIRYGRQAELRERFAGVVRRVARWVSGHGYAGPVGADVLVAGDGRCYVVDLNVRTCGSVSLPLLRGHFVGRGLWCASSFSMTVKGGRREFLDRWRGAFEEGRMLMLSWYEDVAAGESIADVVVGGEDDARLRELMELVREGTEEVTF